MSTVGSKMAPEYYLQASCRMLLFVSLALIIVGQVAGADIQAQSGGRLEPPFELCQGVQNENFAQFKSLVENCTHPIRFAKSPDDLRQCICGIFMDKSSSFYWFFFSDTFIERAAKDMGNKWPDRLGVEPLLFGNPNPGRLEPTAMAQERLEMLHEMATTNQTQRIKRVWHYTKLANGHVTDPLVMAGLVADRLCKFILDNKLLETISITLNQFNELNVDAHFGMSLLNATDKPLRAVLVQRAFCKAHSDLKKEALRNAMITNATLSGYSWSQIE